MRQKFNFKLATIYLKCLVSALLAASSLPSHAAALHDAVKEGNLADVIALLDAGADLNESDYFLGGPLFIAAGRPNKEIVKVLLDRGADPDLIGESGGMTPLHQAVVAGAAENIELLVNASANIKKHNARGKTALHIASGDGNLVAMKLLLKAGADIDAVNEVTKTRPLHSATLNGQAEAVKFLVSKGAATDVRDAQGRGLLHNATATSSYNTVGDASLITFLYEHGARDVKEALEWSSNHNRLDSRESQMVIEELKRLSKL